MQKMTPNADHFDSDSGFKSNWCNDKARLVEKPSPSIRPTLPRMFSFVGGIFTLQIFNRRANSDDSEPLISVRLEQPNVFTRSDSIEHVRRACLYDITVSLHDETDSEKPAKLFDDVILDTHRGELSDSGVSPPLLEFKALQTKGESKVVCAVKKSLRINVQPRSVDKMLLVNEIIAGIFAEEDEPPAPKKKSKPISRYNNVREIRKLFGEVTTVEFSVTRLSSKFVTSKYSFLNFCIFKCDGRVRISEPAEQIALSASFGSIAVNSENSMILNPASVEFDCVLSQEKWDRRLIIVVNLQSNIFDLQISPTDVQTFAKVQVEFMSCLNRHTRADTPEKGMLEVSSGGAEKIDQSRLIPIELPALKTNEVQQDDQFFQDDLRFVQK